MANRAQRALGRAAEGRRKQIAAGTVAAAGAVIAGKAGLERLREDGSNGGGASRAYRLKSKERPKRGIRRIARGRADNALAELGESGEESVHEARKDLKKLRALLRMVREDIGDKVYRAENKRFRDAGRMLSVARDAQVKLETLSSLQECFPDRLGAGAAKGFREVLEQEHAVSAGAVEANAGPIAASSDVVSRGRKRIADWPLSARGWELIGPGMVRTYRRGRGAMKQAHEDPSAESVHEWRKRAKDFWYQLRIVREAWPEVVGPIADQAHELGDLLGDHHDLAVLAQEARDRRELFMSPDDADAVVELAARRQRELLGQALELGRRLYAEKPKAFERRLRAYWLAWRPQ